MAEESKHDKILHRTQVILAILGALVGLVVGIYNVKKAMKPEPPPTVVVQAPAHSAPGGDIKSALDEAGASWIRKLAKAKEE